MVLWHAVAHESDELVRLLMRQLAASLAHTLEVDCGRRSAVPLRPYFQDLLDEPRRYLGPGAFAARV